MSTARNFGTFFHSTGTFIRELRVNDFQTEVIQLKLLAHSADREKIEQALRTPVEKLEGSEEVDLGGFTLKVIHTPGHTSGLNTFSQTSKRFQCQ